MHAPETPEMHLMDFGQGQLVNGFVHIEIDPILAKNMTVNDKHPLRVFVQLEGDCNGVFVTNKTSNGFDVVELGGGKSNTRFQYQIVGNAADMVTRSGEISKHADLRFEPWPGVEPNKIENIEKVEKEMIQIEEPLNKNKQ
jgi:hypothetical protein